jgi:hypothetical protein
MFSMLYASFKAAGTRIQVYAFSHGAEAIFESDDDNIPFADAHTVVERDLTGARTWSPELGSDSGWVNVYAQFGAPTCWPRGFPLEHLQRAAQGHERHQDSALRWGVVQYLADEDPDVDAVFRMTHPESVFFAHNRRCSLRPGSFAPFNTQATLWVPETFALMFLPLGVSDRVTDILRGYMALACLWQNERTLAFASPTVYQKRNAHNLLHDFEQEFALYRHADRWSRQLRTIESGGMDASFRAALAMLIEDGTLDARNLPAYRLFLGHLARHPRHRAG